MPQQHRKHRRGIDDMLPVVGDEQHRLLADRLGDRLRRQRARLDRNIELGRDRSRHQRWIAHRRQLQIGHPAAELAGESARDRQSQPGFADAALAGERDQPGFAAAEESTMRRISSSRPTSLVGGIGRGRGLTVRSWRADGGASDGSVDFQLWPGGRQQCGTVALVQLQRIGQHAHRFQPGKGARAAFQIADAAHAQPGPLGQPFLAQPGGYPVVP